MDTNSEYEDELHHSIEHSPSPPKIKRKRDIQQDEAPHLKPKLEEYDSDYDEANSDGSGLAANSPRGYSPFTGQADGSVSPRPFKRQKGELNLGYLELLNKDIEDAAMRISFESPASLSASQLGLTFWSGLEKEKFFNAASRFGKHNVAEIASMVGSKSIVEIGHYMHLLERSYSPRRKNGSGRVILQTAEYPAAIELSQQCCHAQEEAADAISLKQEAREIQKEENRWKELWNVTPKVARQLDKDRDDKTTTGQPAFTQLFHLSRWLELSRHVFMNSSIPANNWFYVEEEPPSMWATTWEDFHSLAVSITRRLVQTTIFMSMSRIRVKNEESRRVRDTVLIQDAEAAIASLGMGRNSKQHWLKAARRLRLDVYEEPPGFDGDHDAEPLTYDEVERELFDGQDNGTLESSLPLLAELDYKNEKDLSTEPESDSDGVDDEGKPMSPPSVTEEGHEIHQEMHEILTFSAADITNDGNTRRSLRSAITAERQREDQADECDEYANYKAEAEMWNLLQKKPPQALPKRQAPGPILRSNLYVQNVCPMGRERDAELQFFSEWETLGRQQREEDEDEEEEEDTDEEPYDGNDQLLKLIG